MVQPINENYVPKKLPKPPEQNFTFFTVCANRFDIETVEFCTILIKFNLLRRPA